MIRALVNYFFTVLVRSIIGYLFFLFSLGIIFVGYYFMTDFTTAIKSMKEILDTDFAHIVVWVPLVLSLFKAELKGNASANVDISSTDLYLIINNSSWL